MAKELGSIGTTSTERFIKSLDLPTKLARGVLRTSEDCNTFYIGYYGRSKYVIDDLLNYREKKIAESDTTFEFFTKLFHEKGIKESFEHTFYQSFEDFEIDIIVNALRNGDSSLESIYNGFKASPNKNILHNVL